MSRARARISKPAEHGGLVTLGGAALLATAAAPRPAIAATAAALYAIAYMARGPIERAARRFRLRPWDRGGVLVYAALVATGTLVLAAHDATAALLCLLTALAIPVAGAIVTRARVHRALPIELAGLAVCGSAAGFALFAGGATWSMAAAAGATMAAYGASSVTMVRAEVRKRDAPPWRAALATLALLAIGGAAALATHPAVGLALVPRVLHALARLIGAASGTPPTRKSVRYLAWRETLELLVFVAAAVTIFAVA